MRKFVGVIGSGNVGRDPFDPRSFSGSSRNLFLALEAEGSLARAFGVEVPGLRRSLLMARNFRRDRLAWRTRFYLDLGYYAALTSAVRREIQESDFDGAFLQLGAYYDVPSIVAGRSPCLSYHDGNVAQWMQSPYFPPELSHAAAKAFAWERRVYQGLAAIFTMSEYLRQSFISDFELPAERVHNVGAGLNFPVPDKLPAKDYDKKKILFIGIDFERKGGPALVRAFRAIRQRHRDAELHVVGPRTAPRELTTPVDGVTFHGFLSKQDPAHSEVFFGLLQECTVFAMPSRYEPYGLAILEAMSYGMPAVATNRWAFPEMIGDTGALVELDDVDSLVAALESLLEDPNERARKGRQARERALAKAGWGRVASSMRAIADTLTD